MIIDDEESTVNVVKLLLEKQVPEVSHISTAIGAVQGMEAIKQYAPALIFLDIEMPLLNGFQILEQFPDHDFEVIFITAYDHYAIKAIKYSALDYLLKPIDGGELKQAVVRYIEKKASASLEKEKYRNLLHNLHEEKVSNYRLAVSTTEGTIFLSPGETVRLEADGNYTRFFLTDRKPILTSRTLKEYDELLREQGFIRVHRTHLVNRNHIRSFTGDHHLQMSDNSAVEVSRRRWDEVKKLLGNK